MQQKENRPVPTLNVAGFGKPERTQDTSQLLVDIEKRLNTFFARKNSDAAIQSKPDGELNRYFPTNDTSGLSEIRRESTDVGQHRRVTSRESGKGEIVRQVLPTKDSSILDFRDRKENRALEEGFEAILRENRSLSQQIDEVKRQNREVLLEFLEDQKRFQESVFKMFHSFQNRTEEQWELIYTQYKTIRDELNRVGTRVTGETSTEAFREVRDEKRTRAEDELVYYKKRVAQLESELKSQNKENSTPTTNRSRQSYHSNEGDRSSTLKKSRSKDKNPRELLDSLKNYKEELKDMKRKNKEMSSVFKGEVKRLRDELDRERGEKNKLSARLKDFSNRGGVSSVYTGYTREAERRKEKDFDSVGLEGRSKGFEGRHRSFDSPRRSFDSASGLQADIYDRRPRFETNIPKEEPDKGFTFNGHTQKPAPPPTKSRREASSKRPSGRASPNRQSKAASVRRPK
eukprot:TRINITY_DN6186_c0_g1_i10.p1 TRINITY_DN6186_c0_g1~~TRINITY_DN6186_c0_g1_i10.p1  ORF type:complete len:459 (-),score=90.28 TRINITY_DN6186_c0_g1_i10:42-1418(-)